MKPLSASLAALLLAACIPEEGPMMDPGHDCLECHGAGEGPAWSAAGTFESGGAHVWIRDAAGRSFTVRTNQAGSFYTAESIVYPLTVAVGDSSMPYPVPDPVTARAGTCLEGRCCAGARCGCNDCHGEGGGGDN